MNHIELLQHKIRQHKINMRHYTHQPEVYKQMQAELEEQRCELDRLLSNDPAAIEEAARADFEWRVNNP
jgi:hypothetical protein